MLPYLSFNVLADIVVIVRSPNVDKGTFHKMLLDVHVRPTCDEQFDWSRSSAQEIIKQFHQIISTVFLAFIESIQHNGRLRICLNELLEHVHTRLKVQVSRRFTALMIAVMDFLVNRIPPVRRSWDSQLANDAAQHLNRVSTRFFIPVAVEKSECFIGIDLVNTFLQPVY